mgnify:CR=1 FL=1
MISVVSTGPAAASGVSMLEVVMAVEGAGSLVALSVLTTVMIIIAFALTFVSLPMVVDGDQDFLNAMIMSAASFMNNFRALLIAGVVLVGLVVVSALVWFPLIAVAAPIALHAAWHGYRSLVD